MKAALKRKLESRQTKPCKVCSMDKPFRDHVEGRLRQGASLRAIAQEVRTISRRQLRDHRPHVGMGGDAA